MRRLVYRVVLLECEAHTHARARERETLGKTEYLPTQLQNSLSPLCLALLFPKRGPTEGFGSVGEPQKAGDGFDRSTQEVDRFTGIEARDKPATTSQQHAMPTQLYLLQHRTRCMRFRTHSTVPWRFFGDVVVALKQELVLSLSPCHPRVFCVIWLTSVPLRFAVS